MGCPNPGWDYEMVLIQTLIADRWLEKGKGIADPHAKFIFFFTGFNALYYLWKEIEPEEFRNEFGKNTGENLQIQYLIPQLGSEGSASILERLDHEVTYFCRRSPIQRMGDRMSDPSRGRPREGKRLRETLAGAADPVERLSTLAQMLYLVRSNLIHGSKAELGDDLNVINNCILPMQVILESTLHISESARRR